MTLSRRSFLKMLGLGTVAAPIARLLPKTDAPPVSVKVPGPLYNFSSNSATGTIRLANNDVRFAPVDVTTMGSHSRAFIPMSYELARDVEVANRMRDDMHERLKESLLTWGSG